MRTLTALAAALLTVLTGAAQAQAQAQTETAPVLRPVDRVVLVGVPGLQWSDVDKTRTPNLADIADRGASASLSVRTVNPIGCPADGWLTVGAGVRSTQERPEGKDCAELPAPQVTPDGGYTLTAMPGIAAYNKKFSYNPEFGATAAAFAKAGHKVTAVGPGAALAAADAAGNSPAKYAPTVEQADLQRSALTLVDLGTTDAATADTQIGRLRDALPDRTRLIVTGLSDLGAAPAHLRVLTGADKNPASPRTGLEPGLFDSTSTRQDGLVQLTDVAPSLLDALNIPKPKVMVGTPVTNARSNNDHVRELADLDKAAQASRTVRESFAFSGILTVAPIVIFALLLFLAHRRPNRNLHRVIKAVAITAASVPAATYLANALPWERAGHPVAAMLGAVAAFTAVIAVAALLGPWRRNPYGPTAAAATVTAVVMAADAAVGSPLQINSLLGLSPLIAGRFYGFGNVAFAIFAMVALIAAAFPAAKAAAAGRTRKALLILAGCGFLAVIIDGWPAFGSDFGGVPAIVAGFIVLGLQLTGIKLSWLKAVLIVLTAVVLVGAIAVLDWLRPEASRSHLGAFVQKVVDGDAGDTLHRKLMGNLDSFTTPFSYLLPIVFVALIVAVVTPTRMKVPGLQRAYDELPYLRPVLIACSTTAVVGYAMNDSGIQIPSICLMTALPLGMAVVASLTLNREPDRAHN